MRKRSLVLIAFVVLATVFSALFIHPDYLGTKMRPWRLGLDLVGGSHLVYEIDMNGVEESDRGEVLDGIRDRVEARVNSSGVREPQVITAKQGESYRLIVDIAGIKDTAAAIAQIGETPFLQFSEMGKKLVPIKGTGEDGKEVDLQAEQEVFIPTELTGRYVKRAQLDFDQVTRQPLVALEFDDVGAELFETITARNVGNRIAILVDGQILTAPTVNERITGGRAQISGGLTLSEARRLVARFKDGALAAPIKLVSQQTIGATLGSDSLTKTIFAGAVGTGVIMLFMIIYYGWLGLFAAIALIIYTALLLALFKLFGITMTLAGIAGIILSIGMAVDANILIFERTKEEMKKGVHKVSAIADGFARAWPSIRDSNIATIITSLVLYTFTSSFIKGFALALLLGVLVSMFTAITVTRTMLTTFMKEPKNK